MFNGKKILLGVSGGIAAYKSAALVRTLRKGNAKVRVVMTKAATRFVAPLTFETLSGNHIVVNLFASSPGSATVHIDLARWSDCVLICPATANIIAKIANGIADDALTTIVAATTAPLIICPAMNKEMYANPIFRANEKKLKYLGVHVVDPGQGELACGEEGWGRLAEEFDILDTLKTVLLGNCDFSGLKILVTAGRTEEDIDPVRFISNASSGKMGFAIAEVAAIRGAKVTLITGPSNERAFRGIRVIPVRSASQMLAAVKREIDTANIIIMAAAVADFRPANPSRQKMKKMKGLNSISIEPTDDILQAIGKSKGKRIHVGFALETTNELDNARLKLESKNLDLIVVNNPLQQGAGFGTETNIVSIIHRDGTVEELQQMSKRAVAMKILDKVKRLTGHQIES